MIDSLKKQLRELLLSKSVRHGTFTLASGKVSDFYVDSKPTILDPLGAQLIGKIGWEMLSPIALAQHAWGIGGLTFGADPIALAIGLGSLEAGVEQRLQVFSVRKSPKDHGTSKLIEGDFQAGAKVIVVDDVITTGGSTLKAVKAVKEAGGEVLAVLTLVDREEGGRDAILQEVPQVLSIFRRSELGEAAL